MLLINVYFICNILIFTEEGVHYLKIIRALLMVCIAIVKVYIRLKHTFLKCIFCYIQFPRGLLLLKHLKIIREKL